MNKNDDDPHLKLPTPYRQFLISPPASPPVDWEPEFEREPVINYDLISAIAHLAPGIFSVSYRPFFSPILASRYIMSLCSIPLYSLLENSIVDLSRLKASVGHDKVNFLHIHFEEGVWGGEKR